MLFGNNVNESDVISPDEEDDVYEAITSKSSCFLYGDPPSYRQRLILLQVRLTHMFGD